MRIVVLMLSHYCAFLRALAHDMRWSVVGALSAMEASDPKEKLAVRVA